ncbi:hypothetical protein SISSUDRAFT_958843, partial [Sistotremastrum suecicum HHB10207 ss-3]
YKPVAKKINPVPGTMPEDFKIIRRFPEDPLLSLPSVSTNFDSFSFGSRLTPDRWAVIEKKMADANFLWPQEILMFRQILRQNETAIAWNDSEKGQFRTDYFEPVRFPTVPHIPWAEKNIRIPPSMYSQV